MTLASTEGRGVAALLPFDSCLVELLPLLGDGLGADETEPPNGVMSTN